MSRRKRSPKKLRKIPWRIRKARASLVSQGNKFLRQVRAEAKRGSTSHQNTGDDKKVKYYPL